MNWREIPKTYTDRLDVLRTQKPHEVLQVAEGASLDEVKAAYRRLAKTYHPDKSHEFVRSSNAEVLRIINGAYEAMTKQAESAQ
jgi:DnaJ-class molecular chaperone